MIKHVEIRTATIDHIREFYPSGCPRTAYAWAIYYKGKIAGLAGVTLERGGAVAFCEAKAGIGAPKMAVWRASKEIYRRMRELNLPMITAPDPCIKGSFNFLQRLGFVPVGRRQGMEILAWK